jgi:hypothetical protein
MTFSVADLIKYAGEALNRDFCAMFAEGVALDTYELFANYFEPDQVYTFHENRLNACDPDSLIVKNAEILLSFGLTFDKAPFLLMKADGSFDVSDFNDRVAGIAPTLFLLETKSGFMSGGFAAVPWPEIADEERVVQDDAGGSFVFALGARPEKFELVRRERALRTWGRFWRGAPAVFFQFGSDLGVVTDGRCHSSGARRYAGQRECGELIGTPGHSTSLYARWEMWRL